MDQSLMTEKSRVIAFWTQMSHVSLQASLDRRTAAIARLNHDTAIRKATANRVYEAKIAAINGSFADAVETAAVLRDQSVALFLEIYVASIELPNGIFEAAKQAGEQTLNDHLQECGDTLRLAKALAQEEYEVLLEDAKSDEDRERARLALRTAQSLADEAHLRACEAAYKVYRESQRKATEEFDLAIKPVRDAYSESTREPNRVFAEVNQPAQQARSIAANAAFEEREKSHKEADAEKDKRYQLIQAQYAAERRLRVLGLRNVRAVVDEYFEWLSSFAWPALDALK